MIWAPYRYQITYWGYQIKIFGDVWVAIEIYKTAPQGPWDLGRPTSPKCKQCKPSIGKQGQGLPGLVSQWIRVCAASIEGVLLLLSVFFPYSCCLDILYFFISKTAWQKEVSILLSTALKLWYHSKFIPQSNPGVWMEANCSHSAEWKSIHSGRQISDS